MIFNISFLATTGLANFITALHISKFIVNFVDVRNIIDYFAFFAYSIAINAERRLNHLERLGIGLDLFYDQSIGTTLEYYDENKQATTGDLFRSGFHVSHDLIYNRLALVFNAGYYFTQNTLK